MQAKLENETWMDLAQKSKRLFADLNLKGKTMIDGIYKTSKFLLIGSGSWMVCLVAAISFFHAVDELALAIQMISYLANSFYLFTLSAISCFGFEFWKKFETQNGLDRTRLQEFDDIQKKYGDAMFWDDEAMEVYEKHLKKWQVS